MNIALFNTPITFQKTTVVMDAIGNHKNTWEDYYSCHATVSGEGTRHDSESNVAGLTVDNSDIAFTVRWCNQSAAVDSIGYRIFFNGGFYNIIAIDHLNYKRKAIKFRCQKVRR